MENKNTYSVESYKNYPVIKRNNDIYIYSPYKQKILKINEMDYLNKSKLDNIIEKNNFYSEPWDKRLETDTSVVTLITTSNCNLRCGYCFVKGGDHKNKISLENSIKLIEHTIKPHTKNLLVTFFGGEPTFYPDILTGVVDYIKSQNIDKNLNVKYKITTNGVMSDDTLKFLIDNKFEFSLSMDGLKEIQDKQRPLANGEGSYDYVIKTIKKLSENNIKTKVRVTVTKQNVNTLGEIVKQLSQYGIKEIQFEAVNLSGRAKGKNSIQPSEKEFVDNFINALNKGEQYGVVILNSAYLNILNPTKQYCGSIVKDKIIMTPENLISLCYEVQDNCHELSEDFIIGKFIPETGKIEYNNKANSLLTKFTVDNMKHCDNCFAKYICSGGCPVRNMLETNNMNSPNSYFCNIKKELLKNVIIRIIERNIK